MVMKFDKINTQQSWKPRFKIINAIDTGKTYIDMGVFSMENIMKETALVSAVN